MQAQSLPLKFLRSQQVPCVAYPQTTWKYKVCSNTICNDPRKRWSHLHYTLKELVKLQLGLLIVTYIASIQLSKHTMWDSGTQHTPAQHTLI